MVKNTVENCATIYIWDFTKKYPYLDLRNGLNISVEGYFNNFKLDFTKTPCNYGRSRWWFRCPACRRRKASLHFDYYNSGYYCNDCLKLTYRSRQESGNFSYEMAKCYSQMDKLRERITKKGIHQKTKDKLMLEFLFIYNSFEVMGQNHIKKIKEKFNI